MQIKTLMRDHLAKHWLFVVYDNTHTGISVKDAFWPMASSSGNRFNSVKKKIGSDANQN